MSVNHFPRFPRCWRKINNSQDGGAPKFDPQQREDVIFSANGYREILMFPVQLTTSRIDNPTRLIHTLQYVMTIHTYTDPETVKYQLVSKFPGDTLDVNSTTPSCLA